jgi:hypothetical protein
MPRTLRPSAVVALGVALGCVDSVSVDTSERAPLLPATLRPVAEFDPGERILPLPNALLKSRSTGRLELPPSCGEEPGSSAARVRESLNQLDGFGTSQASLVATFSEPVAEGSLEGRVFLVRLAERGVPVTSFEGPVPVDAVAATSQRFAPDCSSASTVNNLTLRPRVPLRGGSTYAVILADGITAADGRPFAASPTWGLVRQSQAPVRFANAEAELPEHNATPFDPGTPEGLTSLRGLELLWNGHDPLLSALDPLLPALLPEGTGTRSDLLLAWAFDTQTLGDPLDPSVEDSAARQLVDGVAAPALGTPLAGEGAPLSVEAFFASALPGVPCSSLGCEAIGAVYAESPLSSAPRFASASFLQGDDCGSLGTLAGAFDDPLAPAKVCDRQLPALVVLPRVPAGSGGYATVVFGHGLGRSKEDLLVIAGSLASIGIASVAIDWPDHGVRAVRVSSDALIGCDGAGPGRPCVDRFGPTCAPQCFAQLLSADLPTTRDHLRQAVLDQLAVEAGLQHCSAPGACGGLHVDPSRLGYLGHSLGALIGGVSTALSPGLSAAALHAGGADWVQVVMESDTDALRCSLLDGLIAAGVLAGEAWNGGTNPLATCLGDTWKSDPGFLQFAAAARWLLDPVDPVNYADRYEARGRSLLVAEIAGDEVIANSTTETHGAVLGLEMEPADVATPATSTPSPSAVASGSRWLLYSPASADAASGFPGNAYDHGSLLVPAAPAEGMAAGSGELGTLRLRLDTLGFLSTHLGGQP